MRKSTKALVTLGLLLLYGALFGQSEAQTERSVAEIGDAYLALYSAGKIDQLAPWLTDQSEFQDPTVHAIGAKQIIEQLKGVFAMISELRFEVANKYLSGVDRVVQQGTVHFTLAGEALGVPDKSFKITLPFIVILRIAEGKVVHHADYLDSNAFMEQVKQQMAQ